MPSSADDLLLGIIVHYHLHSLDLLVVKKGPLYTMVVNMDGFIKKKSQAGFLYADNVCLMASNEQDLQMIFDNISGCISEYGIKVSEKSNRWFV